MDGEPGGGKDKCVGFISESSGETKKTNCERFDWEGVGVSSVDIRSSASSSGSISLSSSSPSLASPSGGISESGNVAQTVVKISRPS